MKCVEGVPLEIDVTIYDCPKSHFGTLHADCEVRSVEDESGPLDHGFREAFSQKGLKLRNKLVLMMIYM